MVEQLLAPEVACLASKEFADFTEIQRQAIPLIARGDNVLVIAPTGAGKTETALLPIFSKICEAKKNAAAMGEKLKGIRAIYITPLRALNRDLMQRFEKWAKTLEITIAVRHGDTTASERAKQRDEPPLFLITTPETLQSLLIAPRLCDNLVNVKHVVIDEIHELYASKRGVQLCLGLARLGKKSPCFQRVGLSATIGSPEEVAKFLARDTKICNTEQKRKLELNVDYPTRPQGTEAARLKAQLHLPSTTISRMQRIEEIIHQYKSCLIFVNTRYAAESIANGLYAIESLRQHGVSVHHSSLSKESRIETEQKFKRQEVKAIVCTSSLELGIDIGAIEVVVQYASPRQATRLVQRVGRSGHKHFLQPKGVILPIDEIDIAESIALCQAAEKAELEEPEHHFNALDVLAHFVAGVLVEYNKIQIERVLQLARNAYSYEKLTIEELRSVCKQLANNGVINMFEEDGHVFLQTKGYRTKLYYYENVSTIPDEHKFFVRDATTRKNVAVLDAAFVSEFIETGGIFIAQGKPWKVLSLDEKEIIVEATGQVTAAIPDWVGEEIPVAMKTARAVAEIIARGVNDPVVKTEETATNTRAARSALAEFREEQLRFFCPGKNLVVEESIGENAMIVHSFYGLRLNETLARILAFMLSQRDKSLKTRASPYSIVLEFSRPVSGEEVINALKRLNGKMAEDILKSCLFSTRLFRHKFIHVAKRFGFLSRKWNASAASISRIINSLPLDNPMVRETFSELLHSRLSLAEAAQVADSIEKNGIRVEHIYSDKWSPLARSCLDMGGMAELVIPTEPSEEVLKAFAATLREKAAKLYCTFCKNSSTVLLSELKLGDAVACSHCKSTQVTLNSYADKEHRKEAEKATALISAYGAKSLFALEAYGIGPQTAGRILSRMHKTEDEFFHDLLEAQKSFIKNKKYWKI